MGFLQILLQLYGLFVLLILLFISATWASTLLDNSGSEKYSTTEMYKIMLHNILKDLQIVLLKIPVSQYNDLTQVLLDQYNYQNIFGTPWNLYFFVKQRESWDCRRSIVTQAVEPLLVLNRKVLSLTRIVKDATSCTNSDTYLMQIL